ncbi:DUF4181 domain-containing protein [Bacillus carboniphilus]|uniref:DUF4181 domain-containing protein n=1 Tax=Bacillus carboniphilus TaxID=86663 RepID=A0ABY9JTZ0_9BACI|nr:DUF4181 domain-containing protein [Bacillus carboniphilus]WLR41763.1 DUF4181 domain-containing protein [Bacillus carboniphilus]
MIWVLVIIYLIIFLITWLVEKLIKKRFDLSKKRKYNKRFSREQFSTEMKILSIWSICVLLASTTIDSISRKPLLPIPMYLLIAIFFSILSTYRGLMVKKHAPSSKEYYLDFAAAIWVPIGTILLATTTQWILG